MDYLIIAVNLNAELMVTVNQYLKKGYVPIGSPYISPDHKLCQALLKTTKPKKEIPNE